MNTNRGLTTAILGLVLIVAGVLFLAGQFLNIQFGDNAWPFAIIGFGALLFVGMAAGGRSSGNLAVPASMIITTGLILLYQNTFNHFESWAYCWGLVMAAYGIGMVINSYWSGRVELRKSGWAVTTVGTTIFLLLGAFFELFIYRQNIQVAGSLWPLALILVGAGLIAARYFRKPAIQDR